MLFLMIVLTSISTKWSDALRTHLVKLRNAFGRPRAPCQKDNATTTTGRCAVLVAKVCATETVDYVDDFIGELLPALVRVGTRLISLHSQSCVEQQDTILSPSGQRATQSTLSLVPAFRRSHLPVLWWLERRILGLNLSVDLSHDELNEELQITLVLTFRKEGGTETPGGTEKHKPLSV